nr:LuxR C-terminal-related transcriptional regulator [uncultured Cellulosilyticum sp.]
MQKNEFLLINNIIYQIHSQNDFYVMKTNFLSLLSHLIPNTYASILMANLEESNNLLCDPLCVPTSFTDVEKLYLGLEEDDSTRWMMLSKQSMIVRESDLIPESIRVETNIYKKCYAPFGLHYSLQLHLVYKDTFLGVISLYRTKEQGDFSDDEMFLLNAFEPHLSLRFYNELFKDTKSENTTSQNILDLIQQYHLTPRESEVLELVFNELDNTQIAAQLCISHFTLKKHIQNLYNKLGVSSRWDLLKFRKN